MKGDTGFRKELKITSVAEGVVQALLFVYNLPDDHLNF